ncbi:hypothetical protein BZG36_05041 [Bifiguratus adelaidae]|uniref:Protein kinase domain-containing protein n=1 Tax=Bifiguratus adelaidae TaxID=1938954 RepID=A0A261XU49_9FUNG|nr:hypothetical protein BZG36_05041 [Bifiguratus adelaidae]
MLFLNDEYRIYKTLKGIEGIPQVYYYGTMDEYHAMVFDYLGPSLDSWMSRSERLLPPDSIALVALQMISILERFHERGLIHGDINPSNMLTHPDTSALYLIDFGMTSTFLHGGHHVERKQLDVVQGTIRYMSIDAMSGYVSSRRDDLESLGYVLLYFLKGKLPWQGIPAEGYNHRVAKVQAFKESFLATWKPESTLECVQER